MQHLTPELYISWGTVKDITACVPSEDSDQPGALCVAKVPMIFHLDSKGSDQSEWCAG